jgi:hypothetical protein
MDHNNFFVNGQNYRLDDVVEVIGMSKHGQDIVKENGFKWILSAINGKQTKAWFTSLETKMSIGVVSVVDNDFVVFPLTEEDDM